MGLCNTWGPVLDWNKGVVAALGLCSGHLS
jgi:hypothetical protein